MGWPARFWRLSQTETPARRSHDPKLDLSKDGAALIDGVVKLIASEGGAGPAPPPSSTPTVEAIAYSALA